VPAPRPAGPDSFPQDKFGIVMKEVQGGRDVLGADFVVVLANDSGKEVGRLKLKLGKGRFKQPNKSKGELGDIALLVIKFTAHKAVGEQCYRQYPELAGAVVKLGLMTTQQVTPAERLALQDNDIALFDAGVLSRDVWPEQIRLLGKPYCM